MRTGIVQGLAALVLLTSGVFSMAERVGDFDIFVQPLKSTDSKTTGQGSRFTRKEKTQALTYKVRMDYKGLVKLDDVEVIYAIGSGGGNAGDRPKFGKRTVKYLGLGDKIEFQTDSLNNTYTEFSRGGHQAQFGKASLEGIAIRVIHDKEVVLNWAQPSEAEKYWDFFQSQQESDKDRETRFKRRKR